MLHIYTDKKYLPKNKIIIKDPEAYAMHIDALHGFATTRILKQIEQAKPLDSNRVLDRFGTALYIKDISTSTKILLEAIQTSNIICADELGNNAIGSLYLLNTGSLYFPTIKPDLNGCNFPICLNNIICEDVTATWGYFGEVVG